MNEWVRMYLPVRAGGERDVREPAPGGAEPGAPGGGASRSDSSVSAHVDTADCFEIEDLDDAGWEFVTRPADPLPNGDYTLLSRGPHDSFLLVSIGADNEFAP